MPIICCPKNPIQYHKLSLLLFLALTFLYASSCSNFGNRSSCALGHIATPLGDCIEDPKCRQSEDCSLHGKCTVAEDFCVATSHIDCKNSDFCREKGECVYKENQGFHSGICVASDEDCSNSEICKSLGKCTAGRKGFCVPGSDEDCAQSTLCTQEKRCTLKAVRNAAGHRTGVQACQM